MDAARSIAEGEVLGGKYLVEGTLGEGAMGQVYAATHQALGKAVAIKTLHPEIARDPELVGRFEQEARAASAIGHRNIVEVFDLGDHGGVRYMVMERLMGESLGQLLARTRRLPPERAVAVLDQVLSGLAAAHKRGIVHRDLKPDNLFLCRADDGTITVKILDFGISKVLDVADPAIRGTDSAVRATKLGFIMGTPLYMSPEQARGETDIDHRTDLWSAGCVLYEMLCGTTPYGGENYQQILAAILRGRYPDPAEVNAALPPGLCAAIRRALAPHPDDRFPSAAEFRSALTDAQAGAISPRAANLAHGAAATAAVPTAGAQISSSALAVAGAGDAAEDSAFLAALDKFVDATDERVELSAIAAPGAPADAEGPAAGNRPAAASMTVPDEPQAPPSAQAFAPPESATKDLELELGGELSHSAPLLARATHRPRESVELPTRPSHRSAGAKLLGPLLALAILGAGGFAGYRYVTLGYVLTPPNEPARLTIGVIPANARVTIDGNPLTTAITTVTPKVEHVVIAEAPGRVGQRRLVAVEQGRTQVLELRLATAPLPVSPHTLRLASKPANITIGPTADEIDAAAAKLALFRTCIDGLAASVVTAESAYRKATAKGIPTTAAPGGLELNASAVSDCRVAHARGSAFLPSWSVIEKQLAEVVEAVQTLEPLVVELHDYYDSGRYLDDGARFAKRKHPALREAFAKTRIHIESSAAVLVDLSEQLSAAELALTATDEQTSHEHQLRATLALARGGMRDDAKRAAALQAIAETTEILSTDPGWAHLARALGELGTVLGDAKADEEALAAGYNAVIAALLNRAR